jgi:hypothetical protein
MRMIVRRRGAHAHEFFGADLDHRHARIVVEMGDDVFRHDRSSSRHLGRGHLRPHHSETAGLCLGPSLLGHRGGGRIRTAVESGVFSCG